MKHVRKFENDTQTKYHLDDYVLIDKDRFVDNKYHSGKIVAVDNDAVPYLVKTIESRFWASNIMIVRMLTSDEIKQYEMEIVANKYNL